MPQLEEIRGGPRSAAAPAPFPAQEAPADLIQKEE